MTPDHPGNLTWRKSSYSNGQGNCVEVAPLGPAIAIRDSKDPDGPVLACTRAAMTALLSGIKNGEFSHPG
jgi:Domain of unknown function (DUF397)